MPAGQYISQFFISALAVSFAVSATAMASPEHCQPDVTFAAGSHTVNYNICSFSTDEDIRLFWGENGQNFGSFNKLQTSLSAKGLALEYGMNAGMYHKDRAPVGLYIEDGQQSARLQTKASYGNFGLVPNGVFYRAGDKIGVMETLAFKAAKLSPDYATQSGPMLVIDGQLHPKFKKASPSKRIRNGVGISPDRKTVYFVKSEVPMNFHSFASIFKDQLKVKNALYLDGVISRMFDAESGRNDFGLPMGPILGVVRPAPKAEKGEGL